MLQNRWIKGLLILFLVSFVGCISVLFFVFVAPLLIVISAETVNQPTGLRLEKVVLTSGFDESGLPIDQVSKFSRTDERIYAIITLRGPLGIPVDGTLWIRWYFEDEQIVGHYLHPDPRRPVVVWIEPPEGQEFRPGKYKADIFLDRPLIKIRTVGFEVE